MSEIKVNKISPRTACGTTTLGDSGDTFNLPSGATLTVASGATITNNGTQTGFGREGSVNWQTGSIKTATFTATSGEGYFCNTTSGVFTVNLPSSPSAGAIVAIKDYAQTFDSNNLTLGRNGSNIEGAASDVTLDGSAEAVTFVYVDSTKGWVLVGEATTKYGEVFITATGGTITTDGNFKIHSFTGPGTFSVTCAGNSAGSNTVDYVVVGGGGSGGFCHAGAGGAGGYRESPGTTTCYTASPLGASPAVALPVTVQCYSITVGAGGAAKPQSAGFGNDGSVSTFSTITSTGGGGGGFGPTPGGAPGRNGGSGGGGGSQASSGGAGNTPPVTPSQGNNGGTGSPWPDPGWQGGGGGGGAGSVGDNCTSSAGTADGGNGVASGITGSPVTRAGGGGGGGNGAGTFNRGAGGPGGGGAGGTGPGSATPNQQAVSGTANTGGGGGGSSSGGGNSGAGGSGIVIIRYKFQ